MRVAMGGADVSAGGYVRTCLCCLFIAGALIGGRRAAAEYEQRRKAEAAEILKQATELDRRVKAQRKSLAERKARRQAEQDIADWERPQGQAGLDRALRVQAIELAELREEIRRGCE